VSPAITEHQTPTVCSKRMASAFQFGVVYSSVCALS
jgi:hypothetical protein